MGQDNNELVTEFVAGLVRTPSAVRFSALGRVSALLRVRVQVGADGFVVRVLGGALKIDWQQVRAVTLVEGFTRRARQGALTIHLDDGHVWMFNAVRSQQAGRALEAAGLSRATSPARP